MLSLVKLNSDTSSLAMPLINLPVLLRFWRSWLFLRVVSLRTLLALLLCSSKGTFSPMWRRLVIWHLSCIFGHGLFAPMALVAILVLAVFLLLHSSLEIMLKSAVCLILCNKTAFPLWDYAFLG